QPAQAVATTSTDLTAALASAACSQSQWDQLGGVPRAAILEHAAERLARRHPELSITVASIRYYARLARERFAAPAALVGPTGESNELSLHGRGVILCAVIESTTTAVVANQLAAALAAGNSVMVCTNDDNLNPVTTVVSVLREAGVPPEVLALSQDTGKMTQVLHDERVQAVAFNGSEDVALTLQQQLIARHASFAPVINTAFGPGYIMRFAREKTVTNNIVATGGNALLLNLKETRQASGAAHAH
ncbi:MAG: aldehyde dehydrogenase family protein, partial [Pseudomonadota bacterium]